MKRIMVADDNADCRTLIRNALEAVGYMVEEASGGVAAVKAAYVSAKAGTPFDCILLDLHLGDGCDGDVAVQHLLELTPRPKVVLCTGSLHHPILNYPDAFGFDALLVKPFSIEKLIQILGTLMGAPAPHALQESLTSCLR